MWSGEDIKYMRRALRLGEKGLGYTTPNPAVGAVVARQGVILGEGWHRKAGTPHAEVHALMSAGDAARGADMYVTLEPCNHTGRTPPCKHAIIHAGIRRVVIGTLDPNPKVTGGGTEFLRDAGIEVETECLREECRLLIAPFTKHSYLVKKASDLPRILKEAFYIASTGRPGPVLIDVPLDVQVEEFDFKYPESLDIRGYKPTYKGHPAQITKIAEAVAKAKYPIICAGGGIISSGATEELISFAEKCRIPVVYTLMGIGALPSEHKLNIGMMGSHGSSKANWALNNADLIMIMGARVGDRAMSSMYKLEEKAVIVHIDIDPAEIGKNIETDIPVTGDVRYVLEQLIKECKKGDFEGWHKQLDSFDTVNISENNKENELGNKRENTEKAKNTTEYVSPKYFLECLSELNTVRNKGDIIVTTEVGQNQIWAANHYKIKKPRTFISSGGMGTMGFGLPSAVGARVGCPDCRVVSISGDGSFQMSMQELGTMKQNIIGVKIVIFNNSSLGMVKELQEKKYCRCSQVYLDENPDFIAIAAAYGFKGSRITKNDEVKEALGRLFEDNETYLLECIVDPDKPTL